MCSTSRERRLTEVHNDNVISVLLKTPRLVWVGCRGMAKQSRLTLRIRSFSGVFYKFSCHLTSQDERTQSW